jgi:hypothetical protein
MDTSGNVCLELSGPIMYGVCLESDAGCDDKELDSSIENRSAWCRSHYDDDGFVVKRSVPWSDLPSRVGLLRPAGRMCRHVYIQDVLGRFRALHLDVLDASDPVVEGKDRGEQCGCDDQQDERQGMRTTNASHGVHVTSPEDDPELHSVRWRERIRRHESRSWGYWHVLWPFLTWHVPVSGQLGQFPFDPATQT